VVILEGTAHAIREGEMDSEMWNILDTIYQSNYQVGHGSPSWFVQPQKIIASDGASLKTMTRWIFE